MFDEMKTIKSATFGEKLLRCCIVESIILSKYKGGLGTKWSDQLAEELYKPKK